MSNKRSLIIQVINLFEKYPEYRDRRYETIEYIVVNHYQDLYGKTILYDFKLLTDIDRVFRMVQQEIPELRGREWLKRQMLSGEITKAEYNESMEMYEIVKDIRQLKLF